MGARYLATMSTRFAIVEARVNPRNRNAVEEFARLCHIQSERRLKKSEVKRFARLQTQLMRTGVVTPLTKKVTEQHARVLYHSLPWWKKLSLRIRYALRVLRVRADAAWLRLRS
jgi:hypothetical protein